VTARCASRPSPPEPVRAATARAAAAPVGYPARPFHDPAGEALRALLGAGTVEVDTSQFRNGLKLILDGQPFVMTFFQHVKPGKGGAFVRTKVKNLLNGKVLERNFRSGERVELADIEEKRMQYLYLDGESLVFMDQESFDQLPFSSEVVGDARRFLKENMEVEVLFWNGRPVNVELPAFVELRVTRCDPGLKGDTASGATKPATLETGAAVNVPLFVKEGDTLRIDTRTEEYVDRVR
jgi:elongation factor P